MSVDCNVVFDHEKLKIVNISARSVYESKLISLDWPTRMVWLVTLEWFLPEARRYRKYLPAALEGRRHGDPVCVLINQPEEAEIASRLPGVDVAYVNHNLVISPRVFSITDAEKQYDAIVNSSALAWKRVHLCAGIENLCCVQRGLAPEILGDRFDVRTLSPRFVNDRALAKAEVAALANQSFCGVILSACEGACLASTEYLLCGLPVVSTPSVGGRHVWYDDENSIIVEPDVDAVRDGVAEARRRAVSGEMSGSRIRENALKLRDRFASNAEKLIGGYLDEYGIRDVSASAVVREWLAETDLAQRQFKHLASDEVARAYLLAGNLAYWRSAVRAFTRR